MTKPTAYYATADVIGLPSGGGVVTLNEYEALSEMTSCHKFDRDGLSRMGVHQDLQEPWKWDKLAGFSMSSLSFIPKLVHFYAGTFSETVKHLQEFHGCKVSFTTAAHRISDSKKAFEDLGLTYPFVHMTDPEQWKRYLQGYLDADLMICPSTHSAQVKREYGRTKPIVVIPHGCHLPPTPKPLPSGPFTVGYLGAYGPDKGVRYLLSAWKELNYKDGSRLILGGRDSQSEWVKHLIQSFGGGNIECLGWMDDVSTFYNQCHVYVQPSQTEGFGIEVLEACAHSRPVICSTGAGACDIVPQSYRYDYADTKELAAKIDVMREVSAKQKGNGNWLYAWRSIAECYTWDKIKIRYQQAWTDLLEGKYGGCS